MIKTFDHAVIYGGVLYPANTPIEIAEPKKKADKKKEPEKEVNANDKETSRKSGTRSKDNK